MLLQKEQMDCVQSGAEILSAEWKRVSWWQRLTQNCTVCWCAELQQHPVMCLCLCEHMWVCFCACVCVLFFPSNTQLQCSHLLFLSPSHTFWFSSVWWFSCFYGRRVLFLGWKVWNHVSSPDLWDEIVLKQRDKRCFCLTEEGELRTPWMSSVRVVAALDVTSSPCVFVVCFSGRGWFPGTESPGLAVLF